MQEICRTSHALGGLGIPVELELHSLGLHASLEPRKELKTFVSQALRHRMSFCQVGDSETHVLEPTAGVFTKFQREFTDKLVGSSRLRETAVEIAKTKDEARRRPWELSKTFVPPLSSAQPDMQVD
jgi:hypothetical protein